MSRLGRRAAALLACLAVAAPVGATMVECVGRCEDGNGNRMVVENRCDDVAERCVAGCERSGDRPRPYAECESTGRGQVARPPTEAPAGTRVRDGD